MYEWLKDYQQLENDIEYLEYKLLKTERELARWEGGNLSHIKLESESKGSQVEESITSIKEEIEYKQNQMLEIVRVISKFKGLDNQILKLKYVDGFTLEYIAEELNYSAQYIRMRHAEMIRALRLIEEM